MSNIEQFSVVSASCWNIMSNKIVAITERLMVEASNIENIYACSKYDFDFCFQEGLIFFPRERERKRRARRREWGFGIWILLVSETKWREKENEAKFRDQIWIWYQNPWIYIHRVEVNLPSQMEQTVQRRKGVTEQLGVWCWEVRSNL